MTKTSKNAVLRCERKLFKKINTWILPFNLIISKCVLPWPMPFPSTKLGANWFSTFCTILLRKQIINRHRWKHKILCNYLMCGPKWKTIISKEKQKRSHIYLTQLRSMFFRREFAFCCRVLINCLTHTEYPHQEQGYDIRYNGKCTDFQVEEQPAPIFHSPTLWFSIR